MEIKAIKILQIFSQITRIHIIYICIWKHFKINPFHEPMNDLSLLFYLCARKYGWLDQLVKRPNRGIPTRYFIHHIYVSEIRYSFIYKFRRLIYIRRSKELRKTIPLAQRFAYAEKINFIHLEEKGERGTKKYIHTHYTDRHNRIVAQYITSVVIFHIQNTCTRNSRHEPPKLILLLNPVRLCLFKSPARAFWELFAWEIC